MSAAYFIVLERDIGVDTTMSGKSLSRHIDALDTAARRVGVQQLSEFFSADPQQIASFMRSEGLEPSSAESAPLQQFSADYGLATIRALLADAEIDVSCVDDDLRICERILIAAQQQGIGWHFEVDF